MPPYLNLGARSTSKPPRLGLNDSLLTVKKTEIYLFYKQQPRRLSIRKGDASDECARNLISHLTTLV
jgi:hypothetical protein